MKTKEASVWYPGKEQDDLKKSIENKLEEIRHTNIPQEESQEDEYIKMGYSAIKKSTFLKNKEEPYLNANVNEGSEPEPGQMSFINKDEEEEAKAFIEQEFLCGHRPRISGFYMALMVYERSEQIIDPITGQKTCLIYADETIKADKWRNCVGRVVLQGPDCYIGERFPFKENWFRAMIRPFFNRWMSPARQQPWCKVGDWVMFPRAEGTPVMFKGRPLVLIPDDRALMIVQNPTDISRD